MKFLRVCLFRLRGLFQRHASDREFEEELASHLELHIEDNLRRGMQPVEARRQALITLGGIEITRQAYHERSSVPIVENILRDIRYSLRNLRRSPGYTLVIILSLALGIGATTAVFSIIYATLIHPYPYPASERMVHLLVQDTTGSLVWPLYSGEQFTQVRKATSIESAVGYRNRELNITGNDLPEAILSTDLTSNGFNYFGTQVLLGRGLQPSDVSADQVAQPVTVLGYRFWRRYYGADPHIVGKTIQLNHVDYTIVGVAPPRFTWGNGDLFLPAVISNDPSQKLEINLRLKKGISIAAAQGELGNLQRQFAKQNPSQFPQNFRPHLAPLNEIFEHKIGPILYLLLAAVGLLLTIGCSNVSILGMARSTTRRHEMMVRSAIGASRFRLFSTMLVESALLSLAGAIFGILLSCQLVHVIQVWLPQSSFPAEASIHISLPVLAFCIALSLLCGIASGLTGAFQSLRSNRDSGMELALRTGNGRTTGGSRSRVLHRMLIAGQIALTMALLSGAAMAMQAFLQIANRPLGYDPHNAIAIGFPIDEHTYPTWSQRRQYLDSLQKAVSATPGVTGAAISLYATPPNDGWYTQITLHGRSSPEPGRISAHFISADYFSVLRIPLLSGRLWSPAESAHGAQLGIINQALQRRFFPDQNPIGQFIRLPKIGYLQYSLPAPGQGDWIEIIGIVADSVNSGLDRAVQPAVYSPYSTLLARGTSIIVRTRANPATTLQAVQSQVHAFNANQTIDSNVHNLEEWIRQEPEWSRLALIGFLFSGFSILALTLAAVGLFSTVAYSVAQRTQEFGIRIALGATRSDVLGAVLGSVAITVGLGLCIGIVLSCMLHRFAASLDSMHGQPTFTLLAAMLLLIAVATIASFIPAYRATTVDPVKTLRYS